MHIYKKNFYNYFALLIILYSIVGCAPRPSIRYTPYDFCLRPIDPKMARIILTRGADYYNYRFEVFDNMQPIGKIGNDKLCWDRYPGEAIITVASVKCYLKTQPGITYEIEYEGVKTEKLGYRLQFTAGCK